MGWSTGSSIMSSLIDELEDSSLSHTNRVLCYEILIEQFENYDCDTMDECLGSDAAFDEAYENLGHDLPETAAEDDEIDWDEDDD